MDLFYIKVTIKETINTKSRNQILSLV